MLITEEHWGSPFPHGTSLIKPGKIVWRKEIGKLPQNVAIGNFDSNRPGLEIWCRSNWTNGQEPWVFDSSGNVVASYRINETKPANWTEKGVEITNPISWNNSGPEMLAALERHRVGNVGLLNPMTGAFLKVWNDTAVRLLVADVSGDAREEVITFNQANRELRVYFNTAAGNGSTRRLWRHNWYRRAKDSSQGYSP